MSVVVLGVMCDETLCVRVLGVCVNGMVVVLLRYHVSVR